MTFEENKNGNGTNILYEADISLKGIFWIFTPFIISDLDKLADDCKNGLIKKSKELFEEVN
jgi:hypothetical protein